jgi:hypothetical protein
MTTGREQRIVVMSFNRPILKTELTIDGPRVVVMPFIARVKSRKRLPWYRRLLGLEYPKAEIRMEGQIFDNLIEGVVYYLALRQRHDGQWEIQCMAFLDQLECSANGTPAYFLGAIQTRKRDYVAPKPAAAAPAIAETDKLKPGHCYFCGQKNSHHADCIERLG